MEPVSIALICAAVLGTVMVLAAFIRQILLSRDKQLNDNAQSRALSQEVKELEQMRLQMQSEKRFDSHYQVLGANKDAIRYIDAKIEEILRKKTELIERYAQAIVKESGSIINGEISAVRKAACDRLREEIDREITFYESELKQLQERRGSLWDAHTDFQKYLLGQEKSRNSSLDSIYKQHSALLEKVYLRHIDETEIVAVKSMEASTMTFKDMLMMPIQYLMQYFGVSATPGITLVQTRVEHMARAEVEKTQHEINDPVPEKQEDAQHQENKDQKQRIVHQNKLNQDEEEEKDAVNANSITFA
ncbi:hypothetical protein OQJ18_08080 [Fluoribacter dumoffii]|uniref:Uncharacterized protein n=1 Tax=Fluoribacter dumoffii TaxID=463 RepID=A0A377G7S9_9GAMM|nr:hypothetical protein [Fluoribacter dumoffii]KTC89692.1 hypothetical protein Ldum_0760 [Fluoribacter dumoffii NY 23]MCW8384886.1 hypothetical protein [Fluoribacter dumoffii]MCW8417948.1 hypothetical protein [Fluoribacter dumoffii]MCW8454210.1 hypothetical protein [Fluoribacter dumoffii]MCW8461716.1 hypothetical protein [Fluoribacter dumoffii]